MKIANSLGIKLTLTLWLTLSLGMGSLILYLVQRQQGEVQREAAIWTGHLTEAVKQWIKTDMLRGAPEHIDQSLELLGNQKGIKKIRIYGKGGSTFMSSHPAEVGTTAYSPVNVCSRCHLPDNELDERASTNSITQFVDEDGEPIQQMTSVIVNEPSCWTAACHVHSQEQKVLGVLEIFVSMEETTRRANQARVISMLIAGIIVISVCLLTGFLIYSMVTLPTRRLLAGTRKAAAGELDSVIPVSSGDELGQLTGSFNEMVKQLKSHIRTIMDTQDRLSQSQKLASLGKLAAGVAHELNNPLTVILNDTSLMLREAPEGSQQKEDLELIVSEAKRCGRIINELLDFTRTKKPHHQFITINSLVQETIVLVKHQALLKEIELSLDMPAGIPPVKVDADQMKQVFIDIIVNATEAMKKQGSLRIATQASEDRKNVTISFTDSGPGIEDEIKDKVFQPFFTTKDAEGGTGLGLAICSEIVAKHGGRIEVDAEQGEGSTFKVILPAAEERRENPKRDADA
jgi:two-component system NtrC family sensor kinase